SSPQSWSCDCALRSRCPLKCMHGGEVHAECCKDSDLFWSLVSTESNHRLQKSVSFFLTVAGTC
uniref:Granulins domain-containing protein n=1 Tax=Pygocentrus nattereri TaxID=42514 RepID=A0AAR2K3Q8_PYGNA